MTVSYSATSLTSILPTSPTTYPPPPPPPIPLLSSPPSPASYAPAPSTASTIQPAVSTRWLSLAYSAIQTNIAHSSVGFPVAGEPISDLLSENFQSWLLSPPIPISLSLLKTLRSLPISLLASSSSSVLRFKIRLFTPTSTGPTSFGPRPNRLSPNRSTLSTLGLRFGAIMVRSAPTRRSRSCPAR